MNGFLLMAFTVTCVILFAVLVFPAVMSVIWRVLGRLFGERTERGAGGE